MFLIKIKYNPNKYVIIKYNKTIPKKYKKMNKINCKNKIMFHIIL